MFGIWYLVLYLIKMLVLDIALHLKINIHYMVIVEYLTDGVKECLSINFDGSQKIQK